MNKGNTEDEDHFPGTQMPSACALGVYRCTLFNHAHVNIFGGGGWGAELCLASPFSQLQGRGQAGSSSEM